MMRMIARGITVEMFVGIHDFERLARQPVVVNVEVEADLPLRPVSLADCLDYSSVCAFVHAWRERPHTELVETLLLDVVEYCFLDARVSSVNVDVLKTHVVPNTTAVGVGMTVDRAAYDRQRAAHTGPRS